MLKRLMLTWLLMNIAKILSPKGYSYLKYRAMQFTVDVDVVNKLSFNIILNYK